MAGSASGNTGLASGIGRLEFRVLGPVEVLRDGEPLKLGGARQRTLLAMLLMRVNELVTTSLLVEELFGERASDSGVSAVRVAVSRLRGVLDGGDERRALDTRPGGYVLRATPDQIDVTQFERLLAEGRGLLAAQNPDAAASRLRSGLGLWRGPPMADIAGVESLQSEIRRLEGLRVQATIDRIEADLALGAGSELVGELEALVAANPLQERLREQLMRALYRSGRQSDALEVYRETSDLLRGELGLEPSRALQDLERSILVQDEALEPAPLSARARLPILPTPTIGRQHEVESVSVLLPDWRVCLPGIWSEPRTLSAGRSSCASVRRSASAPTRGSPGFRRLQQSKGSMSGPPGSPARPASSATTRQATRQSSVGSSTSSSTPPMRGWEPSRGAARMTTGRAVV